MKIKKLKKATLRNALLFLIPVLIYSCVGTIRHNSSLKRMNESFEKKLIFEGTVIDIIIDNNDLKNKWIVKIRVDKIISGDFSGKTFSFRVHSPALSEIQKNKRYRVVAEETETGYKVNPYNWGEKEIK